MIRLVVDASALLSGIVGVDATPPARLVDALFEGVFESVVCPRLLGEVKRGLTRPYFLARIDPADTDRAMREITLASIQLRDPRNPPSSRSLRSARCEKNVAPPPTPAPTAPLSPVMTASTTSLIAPP